uniref:Plastid division protein FtsZ n=1 Tax=Eucampia antarctica TaxID=49252 RepID=A0A7S2RZR7_9STRA|mmetsp:Transcript_28965/g.27877  ORF Transcript_28965/g.27877 Transcript_28965/m.27877 type:complete len:424 (+) Transcript_28965:165-1436(+)|eukprot:CAMPEP_0197830014 /NCGR_PEP_ID=MMETSP1437-20131217/6588_1 /TAXON_ID=49252 ORGANISM="Eucampia antarctica, Strain CCMP1452" /NCGR_SAMPLE_ID=MMETSP1437 /ASSEMBLY_ACC=CAM_ASM_001096 /LENGTH=423 /DNA_ID=CAMNT_0043432099 /DNA_START=162 /DNA_END=1433 /DNA_ORIENTATION=-
MRVVGCSSVLCLLASVSAFAPADHRFLASMRRNTMMDATANNNNEEPILSSVNPSPYGNRGTFLGIRRDKGFVRKNSVAQDSNVSALMPDGGLSPCVIKVLGVGGGGTNAVDRMLDTRIIGVEFWAINTDAQALGRSKAKGANVLNIGAAVTRGLGAGGDPEIGRLAAEESREEISAMVTGTDLCFVTSGMGGGTGSGAAPVVSEVAKESGALTVAIVTKPFAFEGKRRMRQATEAIDRLRNNVDTVIVVSNNKLLDIIPENTPLEASFRVADDILRQGVVGISEIIVRPGLINVDFADVRSVMQDAGTALMGIGTGQGKSSAEDAAVAAISSPLLDAPVEEATGVVFNIIGGESLSLQEVDRAARVIYNNVHEDANVIFGALVDEEITDGTVSITVLATGFKDGVLSSMDGGSVPDFLVDGR